MANLLLAVIYLAFISIGLPDGVLGSAWPTMYVTLGTGVGNVGLISMVVSMGTIVSSLLSERITRRLGAGRVTLFSTAMTAAALFGFSRSESFFTVILWAVPYGLGAGSIDAALNHYVSLHYESRHMSWLHAMWGIGASLGPIIMGQAIAAGAGWRGGYTALSLIQFLLSAVLLISLPLWKGGGEENKEEDEPVPVGRALKIPGTLSVMGLFFCYCALEQTTALWGGSYMMFVKGLPAQAAASFSGIFFLGITAGRIAGGFLTMRLDDDQMIRTGVILAGLGILFLLLPFGTGPTLAGFLLIGLGCAPIYPSAIHATPARFGESGSRAVIGLEMASAYVGTLTVPPLFGFLSGQDRLFLLPEALLVILLALVLFHISAVRECGRAGTDRT